MGAVEGFEALTGSYLGQDWELFGTTPDEAVANFARHRSKHVDAAIAGFQSLLASSMTEDEFLDHWIFVLHGGYDPREDGFTFREWFAHALAVLQAAAPSAG